MGFYSPQWDPFLYFFLMALLIVNSISFTSDAVSSSKYHVLLIMFIKTEKDLAAKC